jgi:putative phosphonate metabolism protein
VSARYALYCAPRPDEALAVFARGWLGYDADTGQAIPPTQADGLPAELRLRAVTEPRRYGFHGTLKAPFALAAGVTEAELLCAVAGLVRRRVSLAVRLELKALGGFLALVPVDPAPAVADLAADCVRDFDRFRAPPDSATLARRRAAGLSERQDVLLVRWGYPYVLEEFRFHMTLTGTLPAAERDCVRETLTTLAGRLWAEPLLIRDLVVFTQPAPAAPFRVLQRVALADEP